MESPQTPVVLERPKRKKVWLIVLVVLIFVVLVGAFVTSKKNTKSEFGAVNTSPPAELAPVQFTSALFDPQLVSYITPLGELNGGYSEVQTLSGVMIWNRPEAVADGKMINVYAPTAMTLDSYSYHTDVATDNTDWTLIFTVNENVTIKFDHITEASAKIQAVTTSTPEINSSEDRPQKAVSFEAGEVIAQTSGTNVAKNWNIYVYDRAVRNTFINQSRYEATVVGQRLITGACPFSYYDESQRGEYLALMGATAAGQSADCGKVSHDVDGTLSGLWHFESSGTTESLDGVYASPLSVYRNSADQVVIDHLADRRFDVEGGFDPEQVTGAQCYALTSMGKAAGYAYFNVVSDTEMQLAYAPTGTCPAAFPTASVRTYYR